jgi:phenylacetate-coenzyme A ligase PaaK-like adenylate-forming protein
MCGECTQLAGLHVPEDLVHLDLYDPRMKAFVPDGECGRAVITTLIPVGAKCGMLLINYDTEDTSVVISRKACACGRTHMRIMNPTREAETVWVLETSFNRVDIEKGVFQPGNMAYLTGEYEAFLYSGEREHEAVLRVSMEAFDPATCDGKAIKENFLASFLKYRPRLAQGHADGSFAIEFNITPPGALELHTVKGRPKRLVDRR